MLLGEPTGSEVDLGSYDPDSGLGQRTTATVPSLGNRLGLEHRLAPHAWLAGAGFTPAGAPPVAPRLLVAVSADAAGIVQPSAAAWVLDGGRFAPYRTLADLSRAGLQPGYLQDFEPGLVPDLQQPPQPYSRTLAKVRMPLAAELWSGEWRLEGTENRDDLGTLLSVTVAARPGRWGRLTFSADPEEAKSPTLLESTPAWIATPLRVLDKDGLPPAGPALSNLILAAWPQHAPGGWQVPLPSSWRAPAEGGPDAQGLWHPLLPLGSILHLESQPWNCGPGAWWSGSLEFIPADPPPEAVPVLRLSEEKPFPPCIPAPPYGAAQNRNPTKAPKRTPKPDRHRGPGVAP